MKTPPFLLGAALLFWGWQTDFFLAGALMAVILEGSRVIRTRWDFSDDDFSRIWTFCTLLFLGAAVYAFTGNGGPARFGSFFQNSSFAALNSAGAASAKTASAILRWLPMVLFFFMAAQAYSGRAEIPLSTISLILRRRWKKAIRRGERPPPTPSLNVSYPYFAVCLFAASIHGSEDNSYFVGLCLLLTWGLWSQRSRRFGVAIWVCALALAFGMGYFGQHGIGQLQSYIQNLDPQWLMGFARRRGTDPTQSRTALGQIGRLKTSGKIIIRLETEDGEPPPLYLREASYRSFALGVWKAGGFKDDFETVQYGHTNTSWILIADRTNTTHVHIACYLDGHGREQESPTGLLPLPTGASVLDNLPAFTLKKNKTGAVLAEGPGLVMFDAFYGPGPTMDAPPSILETNGDLSIPPMERGALNAVVSQLNVKKGNTAQALRAIHNLFYSNFTYSLWQRALPPPEDEFLPDPFGSKRKRLLGGTVVTNDTPLARFLLRTHSGHCEYFATATVLLLRALDIPARYAVGYAVHESSHNGYVVRQRDAHAWCLVWNPNTKTWLDFDTTPPAWMDEEAKQASALQKLSDLWSWIGFQFSKFRWGQTNIRQYLLIALVPVLATLLYQIFFRRKRRLSRAEKKRELRALWPGLDSEFYQVEKILSERGLRRLPNEPLSAWLRRAQTDPVVAEANESLRHVLRLHYRYRFDPHGLKPEDREELKRETKAALEVLRKN